MTVENNRLDRLSRAVNAVISTIMALMMVVGFFLFSFALLFKQAVEGVSRDIVLFILGAMTSNLTQVMSFYFGSSKGSEEKTKALHDSIKDNGKKS